MEFCSIYSGSSGNCLYVGTEKTKLLVDAGLTGKKVQEGLKEIGIDPTEIKGILITHEHDDHIKAVGILSRRFNISSKFFLSHSAISTLIFLIL